MQRIKKSVLALRQKNTELLFEDRMNVSRWSSLKLVGYRLLESAYHIFPLLIPGIVYANERRKPETESIIKQRAYESLLRKGYPDGPVKEFIDNVSI